MTFLEAINAVLRRLREDEVVSTNSTDYSKLVGDFVNQAIYENERACDWNVLKDAITITTANGTALYNFHTDDTKIIYAINDTKDWRMKVVPAEYQGMLDYNSSITPDSPYYYSFEGKSGDNRQIKLTPTPTGVESIVFYVIKYTPSYDLDGTDDSEVITIPSLPVVLNAYAKAVSERGEDGGIGFNEADSAYRLALADAISMDVALNHPCESTWHAI